MLLRPKYDRYTVDEANFLKEIKTGLMLVEFSAPWCENAYLWPNFLGEMTADLKRDVLYKRCNIEGNEALVARLGIFSVPTWVFFQNGHELDRFVGHLAKRRFLKCLDGVKDPP